VISNRKAFAYRDDEVATELEAQIMSPVRWVESIEYMLRMGVREFVELGPGKSMSRLIADIRAATPFAN
jgi:malonyl CoA-acyl carrier protein transacylase